MDQTLTSGSSLEEASEERKALAGRKVTLDAIAKSIQLDRDCTPDKRFAVGKPPHVHISDYPSNNEIKKGIARM